MNPTQAHIIRKAASRVITNYDLWPSSVMQDIGDAVHAESNRLNLPQWLRVELFVAVSDQLLALEKVMS